MSDKRDLIKDFRNFLKNSGVARNDSEPSQGQPESTPTKDDKPTPSQETDKTKDDLIKSLSTQVATLTEALAEMKKLLASAMAPATQDSIAQNRIKLIETVKSIKPNTKTDGVSARDLKGIVINESFPTAKLDSIDDQELDIRYESAVELAREKALIRSGANNNQERGEPRQDTDDLKKIQADRLSLNTKGDK